MPRRQARGDTKSGASESEAINLDEWHDFQYQPVQISDVLTIDLPLEYRHVMGLLYAVKATKERSARVLRLTTHAIKLHSSNPTVWMLRHQVVKALSENNRSVWARELSYLTQIIAENPKNYQAWEHRRFVATGADRLEAEIDFTDLVLESDPKNYHAWSHRQWLVREHAIVDGELEATEWFLETDVRNNSAWNHRWVVTGMGGGERDEKEMAFAIRMMMKAPRNEAVWNYINALAKEVGTQHVTRWAEQVLEADSACLPARRFLVLNGQDAEQVQQHCKVLMAIDEVRKAYWLKRWNVAGMMLAQTR
eukprot:GFKZ01000422.1.p1 GENE.GFKZ01000422.1~~GFKZ01000422.1.p1  ORF type:complete len:308 (+),score=37.92 GFKZ01000422.1:253-1176(+)